MENIVRILECALPSDWAAGMAWYRIAHDHAQRISVSAGVTLRQASAVIAVLSPRMTWAENIRTAHLVAQHHALGGVFEDFDAHTRVTKVNQAKAFRILQGDLAALHGPKTEAFADNIQFPETSTRVTVDGWAFRIWRGIIGQTDEFKEVLRGKLYDQVQADYCQVAAQYDLLPLEVQAVTWVAAHRIEGKPA